MVIIGTVAGIPCQEFGLIARERLKLDDSRDVFAAHGVGGIIGKIMMAVHGAASFTIQFGALFNLGLDTVALTCGIARRRAGLYDAPRQRISEQRA